MYKPRGRRLPTYGPVVRFHGGKGRLASWFVSHLPHRVYLEPFAGSAAVLAAKPRATRVIINDIDGNVVAFYRMPREHPDQPQDRYPSAEQSRRLAGESKNSSAAINRYTAARSNLLGLAEVVLHPHR